MNSGSEGHNDGATNAGIDSRPVHVLNEWHDAHDEDGNDGEVDNDVDDCEFCGNGDGCIDGYDANEIGDDNDDSACDNGVCDTDGYDGVEFCVEFYVGAGGDNDVDGVLCVYDDNGNDGNDACDTDVDFGSDDDTSCIVKVRCNRPLRSTSEYQILHEPGVCNDSWTQLEPRGLSV